VLKSPKQELADKVPFFSTVFEEERFCKAKYEAVGMEFKELLN
jgi:hypothetical protein